MVCEFKFIRQYGDKKTSISRKQQGNGASGACPRQKLQRGGVMLLKRPRRSMFEKNGIFCKKSNL